MAKLMPLGVVLEKLSQYLKPLPEDLRIVTAAMLTALVNNPENHELATRVLMVLLEPENKPETKPEAKLTHLRMVQGGDAS